jgi:hypothetical protein
VSAVGCVLSTSVLYRRRPSLTEVPCLLPGWSGTVVRRYVLLETIAPLVCLGAHWGAALRARQHVISSCNSYECDWLWKAVRVVQLNGIFCKVNIVLLCWHVHRLCKLNIFLNWIFCSVLACSLIVGVVLFHFNTVLVSLVVYVALVCWPAVFMRNLSVLCIFLKLLPIGGQRRRVFLELFKCN